MTSPAKTTIQSTSRTSRPTAAIGYRVALVFLAMVLSSSFGGEARAGVTGDLELKIELPNEDGEFQIQTDATILKEHFNDSRCRCAEAGETFPFSPFRVEISGTYELETGTQGNAFLQVGSDCINAEQDIRDDNCFTLTEIGDIVAERGDSRDIPLHQFMFAVPDDGEARCTETVASSKVWITFDDDDNGAPDEQYFSTEEIVIDTEPPPLPEGATAESGEGAVVIEWTNPESRGEDIENYQVLCIKAGETVPVFATPADDPLYETSFDLCGLPDDTASVGDTPDAGVADAGMTDAGMADAGPDGGTDPIDPSTSLEALETLDSSFICGTTAGTSQSIRIDNLENGVPYIFLLIAVDDVGNFSFELLNQGSGVTPSAVIDFWEEYNRNGGDAEGGVCLITSTFGDDHFFTQALRDLRDRTLANFALGRAFIEFYYRHLSGLAVHAEDSLLIRANLVVILAPLASLAAFWEYTGPLTKLLVILGLLWWLRRRRAGKPGILALVTGVVRAVVPRSSGQRRWRRRWVLAALVCAGLWLIAAPAFGQGYDPYWEEFGPVTPEPLLQGKATWNLGIKAGPYIPDIDSDSSLDAGDGPWESTFGGAGVRIDVELDRYFLWPGGQFGVTGSVGVMGKTGRGFATESCADGEAGCVSGSKPVIDSSGNPVRSAEKTSFRMLPVSLGVVYRFTGLDDKLRIPIIPYGKAGLSYYLWWVTAPGGGIAEAPTMDCPDPAGTGCDGDRALGASLGFQATVGIAVRAERLDRQAALNLSNDVGIKHVGFYAELTYAQVDGFGSATKLPIGDLTWFAGLNFEF